MQKIILINGKKRHGKDYLARMLQNEFTRFGETSQIMSFADPIKDIISTSFGITHNDLDLYKNKPTKYTIDFVEAAGLHGEVLHVTNCRNILQKFGTEAMKKYFGEDVWANLLLNEAQKSTAKFIIVPDFRFLCEHISPYTVKIKNDDIPSDDMHRSENELNDFRFMSIIDNTGRRDLTIEVHELVQYMIKQ